LLTTGSLLAAQPDGLQLTHARLTYGNLGPKRQESRFLPGDSLFLTFDIDGITVDGDGKVRYSIGLEVVDRQGKVQLARKPREEEAINALGGRQVPALVRLDIGQREPAGEYTLRVTVTDGSSGRRGSLEQKYEVLPADFGLVRLALTADLDGGAPLVRLGTGQNVFVRAAVVGFQRERGGQPEVNLELRIRDEEGRPTLERPFQGTVNKGVPAKAALLPVQFLVTLNRPGKFTLELQATDVKQGKKARLSFPITVHAEE
jgi:hypothetical protein